jgi:hypothetical protein
LFAFLISLCNFAHHGFELPLSTLGAGGLTLIVLRNFLTQQLRGRDDFAGAHGEERRYPFSNAALLEPEGLSVPVKAEIPLRWGYPPELLRREQEGAKGKPLRGIPIPLRCGL